jgi:hypothetical protein
MLLCPASITRSSTIEFVRDSLVPTALLMAEHDAVVPRRRSEPYAMTEERTDRSPPVQISGEGL